MSPVANAFEGELRSAAGVEGVFIWASPCFHLNFAILPALHRVHRITNARQIDLDLTAGHVQRSYCDDWPCSS